MDVKVLEGSGGVLPDIRPQWDRCVAGAPGHQKLFGHAWYAVWMKHIGSAGRWTGETRILLAYDDRGELRGILPLARQLMLRLPIWSLPGYYQPVRGFVCHDEVRVDVCAAFARTLLASQGLMEIIRLGPTDDATPERAALVEELSRRCQRVVVFHDDHRIVAHDIPRSAAAYREMVHGHASMKRVLSYERRMQREGMAEIRHHRDPRGDELRAMLEACAEVERRSWLSSSRSGQPRFVSDASRGFWRDLCTEQLGPQGQLDAWLVHFDGQPIAFRFSLTAGSTRFLIANQYDERFAQYRAGWILYLRDLEDCAARGVTSIDMGEGDAHYKSRWGGERGARSIDVVVLPPGPAGVLGAKLMTVESINRRARFMRPGWGRTAGPAAAQ